MGQGDKKPKPNNKAAVRQYMNRIAQAESGNRMFDDKGNIIQNPNGSAKGPFQFIDSTWKAMEQKLGRKLKRDSWEDNVLAMEKLTEININKLEKEGIPVTDGNIYMLHFMGDSGGAQFLKKLAKDPNALAQDLVSANAVKSNKNVFINKATGKPRTAAELYNEMSGRLKPKTSEQPQQPRFQAFGSNEIIEDNPKYDTQEQVQESTGVNQGRGMRKDIKIPKMKISKAISSVDNERQSLGLTEGVDFIDEETKLAFTEEQQAGGEADNQEYAKYGGMQRSKKNNYYNDGGNLTEFNEGGTHEESELGGIPQGKSEDGQTNLVEEGETKLKDSNYVLSNSLIVNELDADELNLPKDIIGMTFADASKFLNKIAEENSSDHLIMKDVKSNLENLTIANEKARLNQEELNNNLNIDLGENKMYLGGATGGGWMDSLKQGSSASMNGQNQSQTQSPGMGMGDLGGMFSGIGNGLNARAQQRDSSKMPEGYVDEKGIKDSQNNQMIDSTKDSVAKATGPFGQLFRGIQKAGQGVGNAVGGETGAAVSGMFSPEEGTMSAMTDKDLSIGEKALATIPGVGGVIAKRQADKRLNEFKFKRDTLESNMKISNFNLGGILNGDPKKKKEVTKTLTTKEALQENKIINTAEELSVKPTSDLKGKPVDIDWGVQTKDDRGNYVRGNYIYYKKRGPGYDPDVDREFVSNENWETVRGTNQFRAYNIDIENERKAAEARRRNANTNPQEPIIENNSFKLGGYTDNNPFKENEEHIKGSYGYSGNNFMKDQFLNNLNYAKNKQQIDDSEISYISESQLNENKSTYSDPEFAPENKESGFKMKGESPLKYAGLVGAGLNYLEDSKLKARKVNLDKIRDRYNPQYADEASILNNVRNEANSQMRMLSELGLSKGQMISSINAMGLNKAKVTSDAMQKAQDINRNENKTAQEFNNRNDIFNIGQSNQEKELTQREEDAVADRKRMSRDALFLSAGELGKEQTYKNRLYNLTGGYDTQGVFKAADGKQYIQNEQGILVEIPNKEEKKNGGLLNKYNKYLSNKKAEREMYINALKDN